MGQLQDLQKAYEDFQLVRTIGKMTVALPKPPKINTIDNFDLPKWKQRFIRTKVPKDDDITDEFLAAEFKKLTEGYWFFNHGNLEYLTNINYFYLTYWTDKGQHMDFVDAQRDIFYWWKAIEDDRNVAGGNLITRRRFAKTVLSTAVGYFRTTTKSDRRCGIQSKTNSDGKLVFQKLVNSWMRLPEWLKPTDSGESRPATILEFFPPREKSKSKQKKVYSEALYSSVDFRPSVEEAYDGEELHTYIEDETGKTISCNTDKRWEIVKYCLMKGPTIDGKALRTTTVEEMEKKGGVNMKKTWDSSIDINPKTARTDSLLTNLFIPADYGYRGRHPVTNEAFVDEFGYSNRELAREYILSSWEGLEGSDLASAQQKNPLTEKHIWQAKNFGGEFDNDLLEFQKDFLLGKNDDPKDNAPKNLIRRVTFFENHDGDVEWKDDPNGHCQMIWDFSNPKTQSNKRIKAFNGFWAPNNKEFGNAGVDPVRKNNAIGKEKSTSVLYIFRKHDATDPENSGLAILRFAPIKRMRFNSDFHRYVMLIIRYYGIEVNYESEIDEYIGWFEEDGMKNYIMDRPKSTIAPNRKVKTNLGKGTPSSDPFALQFQVTLADTYIKVNYHKIYFIEAVESFIDYNHDDRTKFDDAVAFMMALVGSTETKAKREIKTSTMRILPTVKQNNNRRYAH